jgi:hypothetical protein
MEFSSAMLSPCQNLNYTAVNRRNIHELERIQKEFGLAYSTFYLSICLKGLKKSTKTSFKVACMLVEI